MHRHGYQGRKLGRERDQRKALIRSLSVALVEHGSIETTLPKAKELRPNFEKLVSKAKKGDLHNRRLIVSDLGSVVAAHKLVDQIAPAMLSGKRVLVVAHGNSLRALAKHIIGISDAEIMDFEIPTGQPLVLKLDDKLNYVEHYYL